MRFRQVLAPLTVLACFFTALSASAWEKHASLMPWVLAHLPSEVQAELNRPIPASCFEEDVKTYEALRTELSLNPTLPFHPTFQPTVEICSKTTTPKEVLLRGFVDDPDRGIDQDLPESYDPENERAWMGGTTGTTSQGFRHMYFGGWNLDHPVTTFQIPLHAVGQAPDRTQIIFDEARKMFAEGKPAWGWRLVAWSLHYVQDLAQPFHSVQLLTPRMIPWGEIFAGPKEFIAQGTRIVANYHWAYEDLTLAELQLTDSPLAACLMDPASSANLAIVGGFSEKQLALSQTYASIKLGPELGKALIGVFGTRLKNREVDLVHERGAPDYQALARSSSAQRQALDQVSCKALSNAILISDELISRAIALQK